MRRTRNPAKADQPRILGMRNDIRMEKEKKPADVLVEEHTRDDDDSQLQ